ncbi:MAG: transglutaminase-like cysteine peptidase [Alphaproteobacteria bacterium]
MSQPLNVCWFVIVAMLAALPAQVRGASLSPLPVRLPVGEPAKPPPDWMDYCARYPGACDARGESVTALELSEGNWNLIIAVSAWANAAIREKTDATHWGVADRWDFPADGYGDCEDIAILKREMLIAFGLPAEALLLTVVWDRKNQGHAVLTTHTPQGDYVLDNRSPHVLPWWQTGYDFVKRQSQLDPNQWVYIDGLTWPKPVTVACAGDACSAGACEPGTCNQPSSEIGGPLRATALP